MTVFLLTWHPGKTPIPDEEYEQRVADTLDDWTIEERWSVGGRTKGVHEGDLGFLVRQHDQRGIVASGHFHEGVYQDDHWDNSGREANYADLAWDIWLPIDDRLPTAELQARVPGITWDRLQASGVMVRAEDADVLCQIWDDHLDNLNRKPIRQPEELTGGDTYNEGANQRVTVNRYERNPQARARAIEIHGTDCIVCGFNFESTYGERGRDYIHVHHLLEVSNLPEDYSVDPAKDLVPVCANCHSMIHRNKPALTPEEVRGLL
jgi:5-methylcytosine-specific restriction protein A